MSIGVVVVEIIGHRLDHGPRNLRSARPVQISHSITAVDASTPERPFGSVPSMRRRNQAQPRRESCENLFAKGYVAFSKWVSDDSDWHPVTLSARIAIVAC